MTERFVPLSDPRPADAPWPRLSWPPVAELTGSTVTLRAADPEADAAELFAALDHDRVWAHVAGRPATPAAMAQSLRDGREAGRWSWTVRLARPYRDLPAGAVVGMSSYLDTSVGDARTEIGWTAYTPAVWASAVNPETKLLLLGHAFDDLQAGRVQLKTDIRNHRSQQAIARLGARFEGALRRYNRRGDATMRDTVLFSILAEEWPAVRDGLRARLDQLEGLDRLDRLGTGPPATTL